MKYIKVILTLLIVIYAQNALSNTFNTEKWTSKNGVKVVFYQANEVPMLNISMAFAAGSAYDGSQFGLSALTAQLMDQGNAGKSATAIAESLADNGAQYNVQTSKDMTVFSLKSLTNEAALNQSIQTFVQIIAHPDFPDVAFENEKRQQLMAIEQTQESPDDVANLNFFQILYQDHPYAHPVSGTLSSVQQIKKQQVIDFYKKYYVTSNAVLVLVGNIDSAKAHQLVDQLTGDLKLGPAAKLTPKAHQLEKAEKLNIPFPSSQTVVRLGQVGIDHQNPDYFPLYVGNYILGGGNLVSRLFLEVREKRGLTYGVDSKFVPMPGEGPFIISLSTKTNQANTALEITQKTLSRFIASGPNKDELKSAKKYLTGSFPLSLSSNGDIAALLTRMAFYNLPDNYLETYVAKINAVTSAQIAEAFKKQINPNKLLLITVGQS